MPSRIPLTAATETFPEIPFFDLRVTRTGGVADDRGQVHQLGGALEHLLASVAIADVAADHLDTLVLQGLRDVVLVVEQHIEHPDLASGAEQLLARYGADVAGTSCNHRHTAHADTSLSTWTGAWRGAPLGLCRIPVGLRERTAVSTSGRKEARRSIVPRIFRNGEIWRSDGGYRWACALSAL